MRLLLDTHVMIWWAMGNPLLKPPARRLIEDEGNAVAVSVASIWEIAIKSRLPRPTALEINATELADLVEEAGFMLVPVTKDHALQVERLPHRHGDPFDRLLVATAEADTFRLVTHDRALAAYGDQVMVI